MTKQKPQYIQFQEIANYGFELFRVISFKGNELKCEFTLSEHSELVNMYNYQIRLLSIADNTTIDKHRTPYYKCRKINTFQIFFSDNYKIRIFFVPSNYRRDRDYYLTIWYEDIDLMKKLISNIEKQELPDHKSEDSFTKKELQSDNIQSNELIKKMDRPKTKYIKFNELNDYGIHPFEIISYINKTIKCNFYLTERSILKDRYTYQVKLFSLSQNSILDQYNSEHNFCLETNTFNIHFTEFLKLIISFYPNDNCSHEYQLEIFYQDIIPFLPKNISYEDEFLKVLKIEAKRITQENDVFQRPIAGDIYLDLEVINKHVGANHYRISFNDKQIKQGIIAYQSKYCIKCLIINGQSKNMDGFVTIEIFEKHLNSYSQPAVMSKSFKIKDILVEVSEKDNAVKTETKPNQKDSNTEKTKELGSSPESLKHANLGQQTTKQISRINRTKESKTTSKSDQNGNIELQASKQIYEFVKTKESIQPPQIDKKLIVEKPVSQIITSKLKSTEDTIQKKEYINLLQQNAKLLEEVNNIYKVHKTQENLISNQQKQIELLQKRLDNIESKFRDQAQIMNEVKALQFKVDNINIEPITPTTYQKAFQELTDTVQFIKEMTHNIQNSINFDSLTDTISEIVQKTLSEYNHNAFITETINHEINALKEQLVLSQNDIIENIIENIMNDTISDHFKDRSSVTYQIIRTTIKELIDRKFVENASVNSTNEGV